MRDSRGVIGGAQEYIGTGATELGTGVYGYRKIDISGQVATGTCEGRETLGRNGTGAYGELAGSGRVEGGEDDVREGSGRKRKSGRGGGRDEGRAGVPIWGGNSQIEGGDLQKDSPRVGEREKKSRDVGANKTLIHWTWLRIYTISIETSGASIKDKYQLESDDSFLPELASGASMCGQHVLPR